MAIQEAQHRTSLNLLSPINFGTSIFKVKLTGAQSLRLRPESRLLVLALPGPASSGWLPARWSVVGGQPGPRAGRPPRCLLLALAAPPWLAMLLLHGCHASSGCCGLP
jgi:hypothetical protein